MRPFATRCVLIGLRVGVRASLNWTVVGAIIACVEFVFGIEIWRLVLYWYTMEVGEMDRSRCDGILS